MLRHGITVLTCQQFLVVRFAHNRKKYGCTAVPHSIICLPDPFRTLMDD
jgi:hypothetical protein